MDLPLRRLSPLEVAPCSDTSLLVRFSRTTARHSRRVNEKAGYSLLAIARYFEAL